MAKKSSIEKNNRRQKMAKNAHAKRAKLKAIIADKTEADGGAVRGDAEARGDCRAIRRRPAFATAAS